MTAKTINVRVPEALYSQLEELARATARTKSFLTIEALKAYLGNESWQIRDIQEGIKEADAGDLASTEEVNAVFAKYGAKWTKTALRTIGEIAHYIAQDNPARATSFVKELRQSTEKLDSFPGMGRAGRVHGTRELVIHKNCIAVYRVRGGDVEILRIHHVAKKGAEKRSALAGCLT